MITSIALLTAALLLVLACGVFVAAEFAFVTVDRADVERAASAGGRGAVGVRTALGELSTQLSGAQVGITLTNLAIGMLAEPAIARLIAPALEAGGLPAASVTPVAVTLGLLIATILTMIYGELVPKNIAIAAPMRAAALTQRPMRLFTSVNRVPIRMLNNSANAVVRRLGIEPAEELRSARTTSELASLIQHSADEGTLDHETAELIERSVSFGSRTAGEIMTPRVHTRSLQLKDRAEALIELTRETGLSKFPVLDDEESVAGTVHVKHAVALPPHERATTKVKHLMAKPLVVPDSLRLDPLLARLREDGFQLAVVLDEYGGFGGIVTLEDVVEEIVGDIADEHDTSDTQARLRRDGSWSLSGMLRPDEVETLTGVALPQSENYDTVAGLVLQLLGRIPAPGERAEVPVPDDGDPEEERERLVTLTVERLDGRRIDRLGMRIVEQDPESGADAEEPEDGEDR